MEDATELQSERCGEKRKAPKQDKLDDAENVAKKPWGTNGPPPPEWIEMMRKKKSVRMAEKEKRRIELGLPDQKVQSKDTFNHNFIKREVLRVPEVHLFKESQCITIMTYNVLAQSLIRRRLFPSSGDTLKWKNRSQMLTNELTHYQPTILCMQEVDLEQYEPFFKTLLQSLEYDHVLLAAKKKRQGLLIAWKRHKYALIHRKDIFYDLLNAGSVGPTMWTGNVGLCLGLSSLEAPGKGLWVANTHLYWHPRGSYERQRQAGILVSETLSCISTSSWPVFICGDFNSTPHGMTYTALTQRPIALTPYQQNELTESVNYDFGHVKDEDEEMAGESDITPTETMTPSENIPAAIDPEISSRTNKSDISASVKHWKIEGHSKHALSEQDEKPLNITPATISNNDLVLKHHTSNPPLLSLYSSGLNLVQPENAINAFGEPPFTNWAQGYKETLDYIFVLRGNQNIKLTGLLKMPRRDEMGEGEPQEGRFPSDHVCEMVEVQLL